GELDDPTYVALDQRQQPVVRTDEETAIGHDAERAARRADARIDDRDVHRVAREVRHGVPEDERAGEYVLRRDAVRHVDHGDPGRAARDHALHDADPGVRRPEVRRQRDQRHRRRASASSAAAHSSGTMISWWPVSWMPRPPAAVGRVTTFTVGR